MQPGSMRHIILHGDEIPPLPAMARDIVVDGLRLGKDDRGAAWCEQKEVLAEALRELFPRRAHQRLDLDVFWRNARHSADIAEKLAPQLALDPVQAWIAAFIADLGKLVLDWLLPGGYSVDHAPTDGIRLLEAERERLGADHTLVGKWTVERWCLPQRLSTVVWLHHHPAQVLDEQLYPINLIDLTALAQSLAVFSGRPGASYPECIHERKRRLGLSLSELRAALEEHEEASPTAPSESIAPAQGLESQYLVAYRQFRERLDGMADINGLMLTVCECLRNVFSIPAGICYARIDGRLFGQIWRSLDTPMQPLSVNDQLLQGEMGTPLGILLEAFEAMPETIDEEEKATIREHHGLIGVPLGHGPRVFGYFIVDRAILEDTWDSVALDEIQAFARAAGANLAGRLENEAVRAESEQLAEALWRQELRLETQQHERKQAEMARFAAGVSQAMLGELESVEAAVARGKLRDEELLERIRNVQAVVEDALEVTDPSLGERSNLSLETVLRRVVRAMERDLEDQGVAVYEEYAAALPEIEGNEQKLAIAFRRLLQDGVEAMEPSGGLLTIRAWRSAESNSVMLQVSDTGPVVLDEEIEQLFVPFSHTSARNGGGLRLALCKAIVEAHGGAMSVKNDPAHGVRFNFCFPTVLAAAGEESAPSVGEIEYDPLPDPVPLVEDKARAVEMPQEPAAELRRIEIWRPAPLDEEYGVEERNDEALSPPGADGDRGDDLEARLSRKARRSQPTPQSGPGQILLIEENDDLREVLRVSLEARGFLVRGVSAWNAETAGVDGGGYDGIILDLDHRSDAVGVSVEQIREIFPQVEIIAIAGVGRSDRIEAALEEGALTCLEKPIEIEALLKYLTKIVNDRRVA